MKKALVLLVLVLSVSALFVGCNSNKSTKTDTKAVEIKSIKLDKDTLEMKTGEQQMLKLTVDPADANPVIEWSSSNTDVAVVDCSGTINAQKIEGTTVITAKTKDGKLSATCNITVKKPAAQ